MVSQRFTDVCQTLPDLHLPGMLISCCFMSTQASAAPKLDSPPATRRRLLSEVWLEALLYPLSTGFLGQAHRYQWEATYGHFSVADADLDMVRGAYAVTSPIKLRSQDRARGFAGEVF